MKIFSIVGARPNFIKLDLDLNNQFIIHSGQHYDYKMSQVFFKELGIPEPVVNLHCKGNQIGKMIDGLTRLFKKEKPDLVQVFGDTNSTLAGALAAAYCNIPVAHVEAGLRSGNMNMPEEINRILVDRIAKIKLCPNEMAVNNLRKEGIVDDVYNVGDPSFDTFMRFIPIPKSKNYQQYIVLTLHRSFNDNELYVSEVFKVIEATGERVIFPVHPRLKRTLEKIKKPKNVKYIEPQSYKKMIRLISNAKKVITDSGGVQREAYWMNVPVIILRQETEWQEIISKGAGLLAALEDLANAIVNFKGSVNSPPKAGAKKLIREIIYKYL